VSALLNSLLTIIVAMTSSFCLWMGASLLLADEPSAALLKLFSVGIFLYGAGSLALLVWAWRYPRLAVGRWAAAASMLLVFAWSAGSLDHGIISGLETAAIVVIAGIAWINWYSVRRVARR